MNSNPSRVLGCLGVWVSIPYIRGLGFELFGCRDFFFFFFLISKNFIYTNGYSVQEKHRANPEKTSKKQTENEKEQNNNKSYKREREQEKKGESH